MVITKPIGILLENGQKLDEVDMEKKTFYKTSTVQSFQKNAPCGRADCILALFTIYGPPCQLARLGTLIEKCLC